jgi:hypothetical protein
MVTVLTADYLLKSGRELIRTYAAPILRESPAYHSYFCGDCGSPVPPPQPEGEHIEIAAGLFDDDLGIRPDKHIFVELLPPWDSITDALPQYNVRDLARERYGLELPDDYELRTHYDGLTSRTKYR